MLNAAIFTSFQRSILFILIMCLPCLTNAAASSSIYVNTGIPPYMVWIEVPLHTPVVTITGPTDGSSYLIGDSVSFSGTASDTEDGDLSTEIQWSSSIDGVLGTGSSLVVNTLSVGTHSITANVSDSASGSGSASISITINPVSNTPPVVTITSPADGSGYLVGGSITFAGTANDAEDGNLSAEIQWNSSIDGVLGAGSSLVVNTLSVGTHSITASVSDSASASGSVSIAITINPVSNTPPVVNITSPADGSGYLVGGSITFAGTANDAEDGNISNELQWHSSLDGVIGTGATVSISALSGGIHTITANVSDSASAPGSATISITVEQGTTYVPEPPAPYVPTPPDQDAVEVIASDKIGSIAGQFRVDESGSATYSIPIATVAGTAGVAPQVSLNYSSQGGNGLLGRGWSMSGLSGITRCRKTLQQDGSAEPITWSQDDRFCLDGQRLVRSSGGSYGSVGVIYKTEIDSFAIITSHGGSNGHPDYFTVERKDGSMSTYGDVGNGVDSEHRAGTSDDVLTWAISQFQDSVGNRIEFDYTNTDSEQRIDKIYYAFGNSEAETSQTYLHFIYEGRDDEISGYVAGHLFKTTERLSQIYSYNDAVSVREYHLDYLPTPTGDLANELSKLESIEECVGTSCLPKTRFSWNDEQVSLGASTGTLVLSTQDDQAVTSFKPADINGDGLMDFVWLEPDWDPENDTQIHDQYFKYALANPNGTFGPAQRFFEDSSNVDEPFPWDVIDYNADGRMDVIIYVPGHLCDGNGMGDEWCVFLSEPKGNDWQLSTTAIRIPIEEEEVNFGDFNSDGLVDAMYLKDNEIHVRYLEVDSTQPISSNRYYHFGDEQELTGPHPQLPLGIGDIGWTDIEPLAGDFNGDGKVDIVANSNEFHESTLGVRQSQILTVDGANYSVLHAFPMEASIDADRTTVRHVHDINGDGLSDIIYRVINITSGPVLKWYVALSTGTGFTPGVYIPELGDDQIPQLTDYNQDGYTDLIWHDSDNSLNVRLWNNGTGEFDAAILIKSVGGGESFSHAMLDVNGDGLSDYVRIKAGTDGYLEIYPQNNPSEQPHNVITKITNGLGADTDITYGSLSRSGHYERVAVATGDDCQTFEFYWSTQKYCNADADAFYATLNGDWDLPEGSDTLGREMGPVLEFNGPVYVVIEASSDAPLPGPVGGEQIGEELGGEEAQSRISYYYGEAKLQASGRGFLGFHKIKSVDEQTGVETTTTYRQDFPFIGYPVRTEVHTGAADPEDRKLLSSAENIWWVQTDYDFGDEGINAPYQPFIHKSTEISYSTVTDLSLADKLDVSTTPLQTVVTESDYDFYGNPFYINITTTGGGDTFIKNSRHEYGGSGDESGGESGGESGEGGSGPSYEQLKGRLTRTTVETIRNGESETRTSAFEYYPDAPLKGLLHKEIIEPDDSQYTLTTTYEYDQFGNKTKATQSGLEVTSRFTEWVYDTDGRYVDRTINALGQITEQVISRNEYGAPTQVQNIDGVNSYISYSKLGRQYFSYSDTGAWSQTLSSPCSLEAGCPEGAKYRVTINQAGGGETDEFFDRLGRSMRKASRSFDGTWVYQDTEYDKLGRVSRVSQPYFQEGTQYWISSSYDILGRVIQTRVPDSDDLEDGFNDGTVHYDGLTTTTTNDKGQEKVEIKNVQGELVRVIDNLGGQIDYEYDPQGNMDLMTASGDGKVIITDLDHDLLGRKTYMDDPDKGYWDYRYNVFGELTLQVDAKGQCSVIGYDVLGRQETRKDSRRYEPEAMSCYTSMEYLEGDTTWVYNNGTDPNISTGLGQLDSVTDAVTGYSKIINYDGLGRAEETMTSLNAGADGDHYELVTYDEFGRTFQVFDAARDGNDYNDNGIEYRYNQYGYLHEVVDAVYVDAQTRLSYYEVLEMDQRGNVKQEILGNGHTTTRTYDEVTGRLEHLGAGIGSGAVVPTIQDIAYSWDQLGNLTGRDTQSGSKAIEEIFLYDGLNRLNRADVTGGDYTITNYDAFGNITDKNTYNSAGELNSDASVGNYTYGAGFGGEGVGPKAGRHAVVNTSLGNLSYEYDNNGNLITNDMPDGSTRTIDYTTFDKPSRIVKGNHKMEFEYGPDRARYKRIDTNTGNGEVTTTLYIGSVEKITNPNGTQAVKRYINGVAIITQHYDNSGGLTGTDERYLYKDHLGSLDFMTDEFGTIIQEMSYDAWGKRRNAMDWTTWTFSSLYLFNHTETTRGYTGHEMLDEVGLIHMNGRIYDPHLARFVQADPFVQAPSDMQMLNRYSYVRNNPLNATDPSGFILPAIVGIIAAAAGADAVVVGILVGITAFGQALAQGASFGQALFTGILSGVAAGAFTAIGQATNFSFLGLKGLTAKALASGVIGGITSTLQGGKFGHGFFAAGFGVAAGGYLSKMGGVYAQPASKIIAGAVVGGTISEATGGKFANGAVTGAFTALVSTVANVAVKKHQATQFKPPQVDAMDRISIGPNAGGGGKPALQPAVTTDEVLTITTRMPPDIRIPPIKFAPIFDPADSAVDFSAVGPTRVYDAPYLDNVNTGVEFSVTEGQLGAAIQSALQFEQAAHIVAVAPIAAAVSTVGVSLHVTFNLATDRPITAGGLAFSAGVGRALSPGTNRLIGLTQGDKIGTAAWRFNSETLGLGIGFIGP